MKPVSHLRWWIFGMLLLVNLVNNLDRCPAYSAGLGVEHIRAASRARETVLAQR